MSSPIFPEIVVRYCPYVNHNVPIRRGPHSVCMEAPSCPVRAEIDCKNTAESSSPSY